VWDKEVDRLLLYVHESQFPGEYLDETAISKDGSYLYVFMVRTSPKPAIRRPRVHNLDAGTVEILVGDPARASGMGPPDYPQGHSDTTSDAIIGFDGFARVLSRPLATPHVLNVLLNEQAYTDWTQDQHFSALCCEDWVTVSTSGWAGKETTGLFHDEIFDLATDGSGRVRRYAHHQSRAGGYWTYSFASVSFDGRWIAFSSNWGNARGPRNLFILAREPWVVPRPGSRRNIGERPLPRRGS
jgi:hypothetical protein